MPPIASQDRRLSRGDIARLCICTLSLGGYIAIVAIAGASMPHMITFFACVALYLVGPGFAFADWLGPRQPELRLPLALAYGIGFLTVVHCFSVRLGLVWLLRVLPAALTCVWLVLKWRAGARPAQLLHKLPKNLLTLWAALCLLYALLFGAIFPHPLVAGAADLSRDMLWNIGNATALSRAFPAQDIRFVGVRFSYHYLTELLEAALHLVSGASTFDIGFYFAGPAFLAGVVASLASLGRCYFGKERRRATALMLGMLFGCQSLAMWTITRKGADEAFFNSLLYHIVTNINAQATALVLLCVFMTLFTWISRRKFAVDWLSILAMVGTFGLLCVAKGPEAIIVLCSFVITLALVLLFQRPKYLQTLAALAGCLVVFAVIYQFLFAAGTNRSAQFTIYSMQYTATYRLLSPYTDKLRQIIPFISGYVWLVAIGVLNTFCMMPLQFLLWCVGLPGAVLRLFKLDPPRILANGVVGGGFIAYYIFHLPGSSESYFAMVAMIFMTLLAAEQLDRLMTAKPRSVARWPLWLAGACGALTTVLILANSARFAASHLKETLGGQATIYPGSLQLTGADEDAMLWLQANTPLDLVFATNRTSGTVYYEDGISNVYSGLGGRQGYMDGWGYAVTNMGVPDSMVLHRQEVLAVVFDPESPASEVLALCEQEGIDCLILSDFFPGGVTPELEPAYTNELTKIYLLTP